MWKGKMRGEKSVSLDWGWERAGTSGTCVAVQLSKDCVVQGALSGW